MKTEKALTKSCSAALKSALRESEDVLDCLKQLKEGQRIEKVMPYLRDRLSVLNQRVHEYSAYHNSLNTD